MAKKKSKSKAPRKDPGTAAGARTGAEAAEAPCVVVGVGASAGGLEAYRQLLRGMPNEPGVAFVLVQHLDPAHDSLMVELLSKHTELPVHQVTDTTRVEPNRVYVIPPDRFLSIEGGELLLEEPVERRGVRLPIDHFFRSLAQARKERAVCVVLSGTGADGAEGAREVKGAGGLTIAQEPETAEHDGMPRAAIATGAVDFVVPIAEMPGLLVGYARHPYVLQKDKADLADAVPDQYRSILGLLRASTDHDFSRYKTGTLTRRIERRMGIRQVVDAGDYVRLLREERQELQALFKDLLIGVTRFFRDEPAWEALAAELAPALLEKPADEPFRVWTPGCSTGEEPYSVAMLLRDQLKRLDRRVDIQIFATDIDSDAIETARAGSYPENVAGDLTESQIDSYFTRVDDRLVVRRELRELCVLAVQNLLADPPLSNLDLICCRNLLIYLESDVQRRVLDMFHYALRPNGLLLLGSSESPAKREHLYETVSQAARLYRKTGVSKSGASGYPLESPRWRLSRNGGRDGTQAAEYAGAIEISKKALLEAFAPASVMVDRRGLIQYIHGPVRNYLDFPLGEPDLEVSAMALGGLKAKLRTALQHARVTGKIASVVAPRVQRGNERVAVRVRVQPLVQAKQAEPLLLVSFSDEAAPPSATAEHELADVGADTEGTSIERQLALELQATREDLQSTIEELESANEELKASNEEVMSMNEELQSTNEELETSREELQSLNEELNTVNNQLHEKVDELESTNDDLSNLLSSTDMATLFLDEALRIRRYTPATTRLMSLLDTDVGRPISDLSTRVNDPDLVGDARAVLDRLAPVEKEVQGVDDRWFLRRVMPFRTGDNKIDGVVVTFSDITNLKQAARNLEARERQQAAIARLGRHALAGGPLDELFDRAVRVAADTLGVELTKVLRLDPGGETVRLVAGVGWKPGLVGHAAVPTGRDSQAGYTLRSAWPVVVEDLTTEERFSGPQLLIDHGVRSGLSVVIGPESKPWGVLGVHSRTPGSYTADDAHFVTAVANILWESIQRKADEAALQTSEARTAAFLNNSAVVAWLKDAEGRYVYLSPNYEARFNIEPGAWIGKTDHQLWPREIADRFVENDRLVLNDEKSIEAIEEAFYPDDTRAYFLSMKFPFTDAHGKRFVGGLGVDVTGRVEAERALAESERRTQLATRAAELGFWEWNVESDRLIWFGGAHLYGLTRAELERVDSYQGFLERVHPDDRQSVRDTVRTALEGGVSYQTDFRVVWPDGTVRWLIGRGSVQQLDGDRPVTLMGVNFDITARKEAEKAVVESEERLRLAAKLAQFGSYYGEVPSGQVVWSPELKAIFGLADDAPSTVAFKEIPDFVHHEDRAAVRRGIEASLDPAGDGEFHSEHRVVRPDGEVRWVLMQGRTVFAGNGGERRPVRIAGIGVDITQRRQTEIELENARRAAEAANAAKSIFLANMSHEIRTPMTAILGYADVLAARTDDADARSCIRTIKQNGEFLCEIINDILDLSKIESGKMTVRRERTSLLEVLADIRSLMAVRASEKGLTLSIAFDGEMPQHVMTDPKMVRQVLVNLVGNAIKFTREGGVTVTCRCLREEQKAEMTVTDTGVGIAESDRQILFRPFEQIDNSFTRATGGSGLGLAICRKLVDMLGGELEVESELGEGATFRFTFDTGPLDGVEWTEPDTASLRAEPTPDKPSDPLRLSGTVLAVDDRHEMRFLVSLLLREAGLSVETANDGQQAVETCLARSEDGAPFDAVLMDMQMPVLDGIAATQQLRADGYEGPIIALTANAMSTDRQRCLDAGCNDVATKPIDRDQLIGALARWLRAHEDGDQDATAPALVFIGDGAVPGEGAAGELERRGYRVTALNSQQALEACHTAPPEVVFVPARLEEPSCDDLLHQFKAIPALANCRFALLSHGPDEPSDWRERGFDGVVSNPVDAEEVERFFRDAR
ncbi:chemotaxis protein CheB [Botrimarina sp.]|uniref:chemotaxis protein CheB n=1 Tax=Botrimarina sp. TaxID=2795802 RepID=UPI0032EF7547